MNKRISLLCAVLLSATIMFYPSTFALASPSIAWSRTYGGVGMDAVQSVLQTSDGGFLLAGSSTLYGPAGSVFCLAKVDSLGNLQWNKTYDGTGNGMGQCFLQTSDGRYAAAGSSAGDFWLLKTDNTGNVQWNQTYHGTGVSMAHSLVQTFDGGFALAGVTNFTSVGGGDEGWLVKTDALGNMQWNKTLGAGWVNSLIQTNDGGYAVGCDGFVLIRTNSSGGLEWCRSYGSQDKKDSYSVVQTDDGGYALGGWMWLRSNGGGPNIAIVKTDVVGNLQWNQTYGAGEGYSMTKTSDGGFAIAGTKLVKTDAAGNMQWSLSFEGDNSTNQAYSVIQTSDGGCAVAGSYAYAWLAKINPVTSTNPTAQPSRSSSPTPSSTLPSSSQTPSTSPSYSLSPSPSIPEFPSWAILLLLLCAMLLTIVCKKKLRQNHSR